MRLSNRVSRMLAILLTMSLCGCGSKSNGPELAHMKGTVTFAGKPLKNATVVFLPDQPGVRLASGITDDNGRFDLMTEVPGDGVVPGKHRVTITARAADQPLTAEQQLALQATGSSLPPAKALIPEKYFNFATSGLTAEVKPGANTPNFDLQE